MEHASLDAAAATHQPLPKPKARAHHSWVQQAHDGAPKRQRVSGIPTSLFHASVRVSELQMLKVVHVGKTKLFGAFVIHHRKLFTKGGWAIARVSMDVDRQCSAKKGLLCCDGSPFAGTPSESSCFEMSIRRRFLLGGSAMLAKRTHRDTSHKPQGTCLSQNGCGLGTEAPRHLGQTYRRDVTSDLGRGFRRIRSGLVEISTVCISR